MSSPKQLLVAPDTIMLSALETSRGKVENVIKKTLNFSRLWSIGEYLDLAAIVEAEKRTPLFQEVIRVTTAFLEANMETDWVHEVAAESWFIGDLLEAELSRDELEETLNLRGVPVSTRLALERLYEGFHDELL